jgi:Lipocalin-like domain
MSIAAHRGITRSLWLALSFGALCLVLTTAVALAQTKSLKDRLIGHWQLVSVSLGGNTPYGTSPQGSMLFDAGGHYSVIVITAGGARSISYFGTYTVNEADGTVTMHIDGSNRAQAVGRDQKRAVTFNGDDLVIASGKKGGPVGTLQQTWKQAN